ncbi:zf-TFIIB domain-containing protein [Pseudobacteriovorax antillogorgiicola]|uniref:Transcription factor zinc-finger domain-containing protein n=1 Tax=Pseudobacteriovorax antillogorgiicola TaxID=1513793 RepID=A0A1Y6BHW5_9BACT|nr:zf-TFIIB domain-containing protein [Pseudobacteriovorax antillogorgiicola]TCS56227.1 hypothetical protein EDD56_10449 [Pseudobacteriovorax antillogorgiicola]SMF08298.1 hypothetical protein SAMN06296036_104284 [Pseudobacteriovorax antillogorgiicola]
MELRKPHTQTEEEYFFLLNRDLIRKQREYLDEVRKNKEHLSEQKLHWMKCPKCGCQLEERELAGVMIDQCESCLGVYLDKGELDLILTAKKPEGFLARLRTYLSKDLATEAM